MFKKLLLVGLCIGNISTTQTMGPAILAGAARGVIIPAVFSVPYLLMNNTKSEITVSDKLLVAAVGIAAGGALGALGGGLSYMFTTNKAIAHVIVSRAKQCGIVAGMTAGFGIVGCWALNTILPRSPFNP